jgi:hypothetical protein
MELHGAIHIFKLVIGGDMAFQGGSFWHAGAASTFFCLFAIWPVTTSTSPPPTTSARA